MIHALLLILAAVAIVCAVTAVVSVIRNPVSYDADASRALPVAGR